MCLQPTRFKYNVLLDAIKFSGWLPVGFYSILFISYAISAFLLLSLTDAAREAHIEAQFDAIYNSNFNFNKFCY